MRYYFDNRNFTSTYVKVTVNGNVIGYSFLRKNSVTCIELPENSHTIQLSFRFEKYYDIPELHKQIISADSYPYSKKKLSQEQRHKIDDAWKFPYDCVIENAERYGDCYFFPAEYKEMPLIGGLYYTGYSAADNTFVPLKLVKSDISLLSRKSRRKTILMYSCGMIAIAAGLIYTVQNLLHNDLSPFQERGMLKMLFGLPVCAFGIVLILTENITYGNTWRDKALKESYYVTEEGLLDSVDERQEDEVIF